MSDVTQILERVEAGEPKAADELLSAVYQELRKLAAVKLMHEPRAKLCRRLRWCMKRG